MASNNERYNNKSSFKRDGYVRCTKEPKGMRDKKDTFPSKAPADSRDILGRGHRGGRAHFALGWRPQSY